MADDLPFRYACISMLSETQQEHNTALGHTSSNHDEYNGYFIPKGTIVLGNAWFVSIASIHNSVTYILYILV